MNYGKVALSLAGLALVVAAQASTWSYDFQGGSFATDWTVNSVGGNGNTLSNIAPPGLGNATTAHTVEGGYDYVSRGIPLAPRSAAGGGRGLFMNTNATPITGNNGSQGGVIAVPNLVSLAGEFVLTFDVWSNVLNGTSGTTQYLNVGFGAAASNIQATTLNGGTGAISGSAWSTAPTSGTGFTTTGTALSFTTEGGGGRDVKYWRNGVEVLPPTPLDNPVGWQAAGNAILRADTGNAANAGWYGLTFPAGNASQLIANPSNRWLTMTVTVTGNTMTWSVLDPVLNPGGTNTVIMVRTLDANESIAGALSVGLFDTFAGINNSGGTNVTGSLFAVYDNFEVAPVPEPGTMIALGAGLAALAARRRKKA